MTDFVSAIDIFGNFHKIAKEKTTKRSSSYGMYMHNEQILLVKEKHSGKWDIPGGGREKGETVAKALQREFREETGLEIAIGKAITRKENYFFEIVSGKTWDAKRYYFFVDVVGGTLLAAGNDDDVLEAKMFPLATIPELVFTPSTAEIMQEFCKKSPQNPV